MSNRPTFSDCTVQMKFRVPPELRDELHKSADRHMRTVQGEIIWRLYKSVEEHPIPPLDQPVGEEV